MNSKQKNAKEQFFNCCEGMDFAKMMQKMMEQKSGCCDFDCAEMMERMMTMCYSPGQVKEETTGEA